MSNNGSGDTLQQYPPEFIAAGIRPLHTQIDLLAKAFPGLNVIGAHTYCQELPKLPENAEGWFAIPTWEAMARLYHPHKVKHFVNVEILITRAILQELEKKFCLRKNDELFKRKTSFEVTSGKVFTNPDVLENLEKIRHGQENHDIIIIPAQFGKRQIIDRFSITGLDSSEYQLDMVSIMCMILTHPERQIRNGQLQTACDAIFPDKRIFHYYYKCFESLYDGSLRIYFNDGAALPIDDNAKFGLVTGFKVS